MFGMFANIQSGTGTLRGKLAHLLKLGTKFNRRSPRYLLSVQALLAWRFSNYYSVNSRMEQPQRILFSRFNLLLGRNADSWSVVSTVASVVHLLQELDGVV